MEFDERATTFISQINQIVGKFHIQLDSCLRSFARDLNLFAINRIIRLTHVENRICNER